MTCTELDIRRKVASTPMGETVAMELGGMDYEHARMCALRFSRLKMFPIMLMEPDPGRLKFKRVTADEAKTVAYAEMGLLKIGESHLFNVPRPMHQRVRMAASVRNRSGAVLLSCAVEAGGIRVTRHPLTQDEIDAHGPIHAPARASKYGIERLETETELRFIGLSFVETRRLRLAVSNKGQAMGWKLRCRLQDDGSMLVKRMDRATGDAQ